MKKILLIILGILAFFVISLALIPILFKKQIKEQVDKQLANNLNAKVYFDENKFGISLLRNFPNLTVSLADFGIIGKGDFEGDTLADIATFRVMIDVMSIIKSSQIKVKEIVLEQPRIMAQKLHDGKANWDIAKPSAAPTKTADTTKAKFDVAIEKWSITEGMITYIDAQNPMSLSIIGLNHSGTGDFSQDIFDLQTQTTINSVSFEKDTVEYVSNRSIDAALNLNINQPEKKYTFRENSIKINDFVFGFDGNVQMPDTNIIADITFKTKETGFKNIISLIPAIFINDYKSLTTSGSMALDGFVKGTYNRALMPTFGLNLQIKDGMFQYPSLPAKVSDVNLDLSVLNQTTQLKNTGVEIKKFHVLIGKNPIDMKGSVKGLENMLVDANVAAKLNLADLTSIFPMPGLALRGIFSLDLDAKGNFNAAKKVFPALKAKANLVSGYVKSDKFAAPIEQISLDMQAENPSGQIKDTKVDISRFAFMLQNEPFEINAQVQDFDDYSYKIKAKGMADLGKLTKIYPLEGMSLAGRMAVDIATQGRMSDIKAKRYDLMPTSGTIGLNDFSFSSKTIPHKILISKAQASLSPKTIALSQMNGSAGNTDFRLNGSLSNYIGYIMSGQTLVGKLDLKSDLADVNQWISQEKAPKPTTTNPAPPMDVVQVPKNLDIEFNSLISKLLYSNLTLEDMQGKITVQNGIVNLSNLIFSALGGKFGLKGVYNAQDIDVPKFDFDLDINEISFDKAYQTFNTIKVLAPIAKELKGKFSTKFKLTGLLDNHMNPVLQTLNGGGLVSIANAAIEQLPMLSGIGQVTKLKAFSGGCVIKDVLLNTELKNGRVFFKPFDIKAGNQIINIGGSNGFDGVIDYVAKMKVPAAAAVALISNNLGGLLGNKANLAGQNINVNLGIGGTQSNPTFRLLSASPEGGSLKNAAGAEIGKLKDRAKQEADRIKAETEAKVRDEVARQKLEAEQRIQAEKDRLKREAEEKIRQEADKWKDKIKIPR